MRIELWSYHYSPEQLGVGPISSLMAAALRDRGHDVVVVASHPSYPQPVWGRRLRPYRERRDGISVLRLPAVVRGRGTGDRILSEVTFSALELGTLCLLERPDVAVAVTPSLMGVGPVALRSRLRGVPWVLWLQDLVLDGAVSTGLLPPSVGRVVAGAEIRTYSAATRVVAISRAFETWLLERGVPPERIETIYNPATFSAADSVAAREALPRRLLWIGNMGHSHGLAGLIEELEAKQALERADATFTITGTGATEDQVRAAITDPRVRLEGLVSAERLDEELDAASLGLVGQRADVEEFNLPSRLMTLMGRGIPVVVAAHPDSELAWVVNQSGGGWVADIRAPGAVADAVVEAFASPEERARRGEAARRFAEQRFSAERFADQFEAMLVDACAQAG